MILNGSAHVLFEFEKNNKQSLKIDLGTQKKRGMLNVIKQLQYPKPFNLYWVVDHYQNGHIPQKTTILK